MSQMPADWIAFALFLVLCAAVVLGEVFWLTRNAWATPGKAIAYVLITDVLGLGVGLFTFFAAIGVMMMMAFGSSGQGGTAPEPAYWVATAFGLLFPPLFMLSLKRLFLLIFGIRTGRSAWAYSLVVTALVILVALAPPVILFWTLGRVF